MHKLQAETLRDKKCEVKAKALLNALADTLAEIVVQ